MARVRLNELRALASAIMSAEGISYEMACAKAHAELSARPGGLERGRGGNMDRLNLFAEFTKRDDAEQIVSGIASTGGLDNQGEVVRPEAIRQALPTYSGALREMHAPIAAGRVISSHVNDRGELEISAKVVDASTWAKVKEGVLRGFSIGGRVLKRIENVIHEITLTEISLVDIPANSRCVVTMWKADTKVALDDDYETRKRAIFAQIDRDERSGFLKKTSAASQLLEKAAGVGGIENAVTLNPDLHAKLKAEPLPADLLPSETIALTSARSGLPQWEVLKLDPTLSAAYDEEMRGIHPTLVARREAETRASRESYALRKSLTADGPIAVASVQVFVNGAMERDATRARAWIQWCQRDRTVALQHRITFQIHGSVIQADDIERVK